MSLKSYESGTHRIDFRNVFEGISARNVKALYSFPRAWIKAVYLALHCQPAFTKLLHLVHYRLLISIQTVVVVRRQPFK